MKSKRKILIVEDVRFWEEIPRLKKVGYVPFAGKFSGLKVKVIREISDLDSVVIEFQPDLISFNAAAVPNSWFPKIKKLKGNYKITLACYEPPLYKVQKLLNMGIFDIFWTLKPRELAYWYRKVFDDPEMPLSYTGCSMYWGARVSWV